MSVSDRVTRRKEATRQRIVEAAMTLFVSQGFEATSVAQITSAADIGKGTFFTYFATKQDVLSFLGEQVMTVMSGANDAALPAPMRLRAVFSAVADWFAANEDAARQLVIARLSSLGETQVSSSSGALSELIASIIREGIDAGQLRNVDVEAATTMVASAYFVPVAQWAWDRSGPSLSSRFDAQLNLVIAALTA